MFKTFISTTMNLYFVQIYLNKYIYETFLSSNPRQKKLALKLQLPNQDQRETTPGDFYLPHPVE